MAVGEPKLFEQPDRATLERIVRRWRSDAEVVRRWDLVGGSSAEMTAFEVASSTGGRERLILRHAVRDWHDAATEYRVLEHLAPTDILAPEPLLLDESRELLPEPYLLMRYLDGAWTIEPPDCESYARLLADQLAAIHRAPLPTFRLPSATQRATQRIERAEPSPARDALVAAWPLALHNDERLLHGDYWPCNVLWHDEEIGGVIDWEDAARGDPLADLATCRFDLTAIVGRDVGDTFTARYLETSGVDRRDLPYWDLLAALHAAPHLDEWSEGWLELGYADLDRSSLHRHHDAFVQRALEALQER